MRGAGDLGVGVGVGGLVCAEGEERWRGGGGLGAEMEFMGGVFFGRWDRLLYVDMSEMT